MSKPDLKYLDDKIGKPMGKKVQRWCLVNIISLEEWELSKMTQIYRYAEDRCNWGSGTHTSSVLSKASPELWLQIFKISRHIKANWGWRNDLAVKRAFCSPRGATLSSHNPIWFAHNILYIQLLGSGALSSLGGHCTQMAHTQLHEISFKS